MPNVVFLAFPRSEVVINWGREPSSTQKNSIQFNPGIKPVQQSYFVM